MSVTCACGYDKNLGDISSRITSSWDPLTNSQTILATKESKSIVGIKGYLMDAMRDVSAAEAAVIYGLEPVWGAAFAWFLLGERWDTTEWFGAALVLCGSLTVQILGSTPAESLNKEGERSSKRDHSITSDNQNDFSLLPVVVKTKKNDDALFRNRQDKL